MEEDTEKGREQGKMKKTMMKRIRRAFAILACMAMVLGMNIGHAFAIDDTSTGTITLNNLESGTAIDGYKIMDVNTENGVPKDPVFTWASAIQDWVKTNYPNYIDATTKEVTQAFSEAPDETVITQFYEQLAAKLEVALSIPPSFSKIVAAGADSVTISDVAMGAYLIVANGGMKIYSPTTAHIVPEATGGTWSVKDATINMKGEAPTIEKNISAPTDLSVAIGDTISYQLNVRVPDYPQDSEAMKFAVGDCLSKGLTLKKATIKVYESNNGTDTEITNDNYSVTENNQTSKGTSYTFQLEFTEEFIKAYAGKMVKITYDAEVNEDAVKIDTLKNTAYLGYNNDPYDANSYKETFTFKQAYTYGLTLNKKDADDESKQLADAEFTLSKKGESDALKFTKHADGYYYLDAGGDTKLVSGTDGMIRIEGLDEGTYVLKETKVPAGGYVLPKGEIEISIKESTKNGVLESGEVTVTSTGTTMVSDPIQLSENHITFDVKNAVKGSIHLPETGGKGTALFFGGGAILMGAGIFLILKKRKEGQNA